jgi:hypothetical protein
VGADEAPKLLLAAPCSPRRLLLERAERSKLTLGLDNLFHTGGTKAADQLVLQVGDAHIEPEGFHVGATEVGSKADPLQTAPEVALLTGVTQARQSEVQAPRTEQFQEVSDVPRTAHWHEGNALSGKISTTALSERLERDLVADPLNQHDRLWVDAGGERVGRRGNQRSPSAASQRLDSCQLESLLVVHLPSLVSSHARELHGSLACRWSWQVTSTASVALVRRSMVGCTPTQLAWVTIGPMDRVATTSGPVRVAGVSIGSIKGSHRWWAA